MDNALHHYVPQFYLKRFLGTNKMLWVYDKDTDRIFSTNPRNLAAEHGFYTLPDIFPDSSEMEKQFSDLERDAAMITKDWLNHLKLGNSIHIPKINRETMSLYITTQLLRTAESRAILLEGIASLRTMPNKKEGRRDLHTMLLWDEEIIEKFSDWVHSCTWVFRVNTTADLLYTSDDPFKVRSKTEHLHWAQIFSPGAYLLIGISSIWLDISSLSSYIYSKKREIRHEPNHHF